MNTTEELINYLDKHIHKNLIYECMPENEHGYYYVPRESIKKIVDGLIPLIKPFASKQNAVEFACYAVVSTGRLSDDNIPDVVKETEDLYDDWKPEE